MEFYYIGIAINLLAIAAIIFVLYAFLIPPLLGAPFVATNKKTLQQMIELADIKPGERAVDLGSGDGRIVIALAKAGAQAHGYEINPILVFQSRMAIRRHKLCSQAHIHFRSFRSIDFSKFNIIAIYGLPGIMKHLEGRIQQELPSGGRVVSHTFQFPNWPNEANIEKVYLYRKI